MGKNLKDLIEEIKIANQTQLIEAQIAANIDPSRQLRQVLREKGFPSGPGPATTPYSGLSRAFNTKSGSPRFSIVHEYSYPPPEPPSTPEKKTPQTYNWSPITTMEPGLAIPYVYGTMKTKGNVISGNLGGSNIANFQQCMKVLVALGKGPIESFVSASLNGFPLYNTETFAAHISGGESWGGYDFRYGWNTQPTLSNAQSNVYDNYRNIPCNDIVVSNGTPVIITQDMTGYDDAWIYLKFPSGLYGQPESSSDLVSETCHVKVEQKLSASGSYTTVFDGDISYSSRTAVRYYIRITNDQQGYYYIPYADASYDFRVTKTTANKTLENNKAVNDLVVEYLTVGIRDDFAYNGIAMFGVYETATENINGSVDVSVVIKGRKVRVYSNPTTYALQWSDNPAWVCLDVLTQPIWSNDSYSWNGTYYVPGTFTLAREDGIPIANIDVQSFIDWANWCDGTVVPPSYDLTDTKRCTFNGIFESITNLWDAAQSVANNARAWLLPPSGTSKYKVVLDKPTAVTQIFTTGNIIEGSLEETYTSMVDRATSLQVDFINRDNNWEQDTLNVVYTDNEGIKEDSLSLFGITVPSQAWRRAMLALYYNAVTRLECQFDVGQDALNCEVGDVVGVQHELPQWGYGGRVVSATAAAITLDRPVAIESGIRYQLAVRNSDDTLTIFPLHLADNPVNPSTTIVYGTFSPVPAQYDPFAFGPWFEWGGERSYKPFRVLEIKDNGDDTFHLVCQEYNDSVYGIDSQIPPIATPNYSNLDAFPDVTLDALDEILILNQDGSLIDCIDVYFRRPESSVYAKAAIYYRQSGATQWIYSGSTDKEKYRIENVLVGVTYQVAVVSVNTSGRKGDLASAPTLSVLTLGKADPPSNVVNFRCTQSGTTIIFTWDHIEDADLWGYEIREGWSFQDARVLIDIQSANRYDYPAALDGTYRFWIKAIDTSGNYSAVGTAVDFTVTGIDDTRNFIVDLDVIQTYDASGESIYGWSWVSAGFFFTWSPSG